MPRSLLLERVGRCCVCGTGDHASPIATGEDFEYETSDDTFIAQHCLECGLVYLDPRPAMSELPKIYGAAYHAYEFTPERYGMAYRVRAWLETRRLRRWTRDLPLDARIIDVGAGDGFHLSLLSRIGKPSWALEGVDPDPKAVEAARSNGLTMHVGVLDELALPADAFDFALLIMTIEHVAEPEQLLREVRRILKPGGRVGIVTDNTGSPDFALAKRRHWGGYHFPRHWNLFDERSMRRLATNADFEVVSLRTMMSPVNWTYSVHNLLKDWGAPSILTRQFGLDKPIALGFFTVVDSLFTFLGKGALLRVMLRKES
ncbi:MAG: class I SAM-dependent methyltransferase [Acidimicrobiia bacterium]|nr:class I SAM-dependent methyltransferase [Acidimicrobiia bacterium]